MELPASLQPYLDQISEFVQRATGTWVLYQGIAILVAALCSYLFAKSLSRRLKTYLGSHEGHWLRSWKREILERVSPAIFLVAIWLLLALFRSITWSGNTLILATVAKLTTAWIIINILATVIRNQFLFRVVSITLWIIASLSILGVLPQVVEWLDGIAFSFGESRLSALVVMKAIAILAILAWGVGLLGRLADKGVAASKDISPSMKVLISKLVRIFLVAAAVLLTLSSVGIDLTAFAIFSGAVGVGVGLGLQKTVSNFVSGISLLLDKSIKPGDVISVGDTFGWITQLNTRYTSVITRDGREHLIPNENLIAQEVVNWSYSNRNIRLEITFGVSYDCDPHEVKRLVESTVGEHPRVLASPAPIVQFVQFGESSLDMAYRFWIQDPAGGLANIKSDILFAIWDVLKENNIEIPYAKRDLYMPDGIKVDISRSKAPPES